jgi:hypothetical protein
MKNKQIAPYHHLKRQCPMIIKVLKRLQTETSAEMDTLLPAVLSKARGMTEAGRGVAWISWDHRRNRIG